VDEAFRIVTDMIRKAVFIAVGDLVRDANLEFRLCGFYANVETFQSAGPGIISGIEGGGFLRRCRGGLGNRRTCSKGRSRRAGDLAEERAAR
jgi:hypothetical protein